MCTVCGALVDSGEDVINLNRINKNNFARLPRAKKELSDQLSTAVCQFLASCEIVYFSYQAINNSNSLLLNSPGEAGYVTGLR